ncbi:MAG TPA: ATP-binding protein [Thermoanaerobaculia bacterium]|jgi:two-component system sensor histidine kinase PilS (NtrC family)
MTPLARQLRWYIVIRVVAIVSVLLPFGLFQLWMLPATPQPEPAPGVLGPPTPALSVPAPVPEALPRNVVLLLGGATFGATLFYIALLRLLRRRPTAQAYLQFFGDLLLITGLVYFLGGVTSPFSLLYLIVIAVASALLRRRAGVTVASAALLMYGGLILALFFGWLQPAVPGQEVVTGWRLGYNLAVHGFGFYAVALLTYYLAHNVTRAERALEEKSEHLADLQVVHRDVIQSISSGLLTTDLEGTVTSANLAGLEILGRSEEELAGAPIQQSGLFTAEQWREATAASEQTGRMRSEVELMREKESRYIGFSISRLTDGFGHHRGYIVIFQDLTRWRRIQEELRMKDRMVAVGELAAGLAHEIGNPLAAISGSVQMLSSSVNGDPAQRKLIDILLKESHRLDRTIKGFLRFARPRERSSVSFDIARLLAENCELLKNSEEVTERHRLEVVLDPPSARLFADPDQVSQIFWNLARNALRAMPDGGTLRVAGRLAGDWYRLQVVDTGHGMTEEQRTNLFHPFQSFFDGGTGIGMAIVYRIVQDHGGRLRVDSRPGAGTTITVELPTAGSSVTLVSAEASA